MPEFREQYDQATRNYISYTLYTKKEIKKQWPGHKLLHFANMRENGHYITCTVRCEDEAIVLIALMMRRANKTPNNFYYDEGSKKVLVFCLKSDSMLEIKELYESVIVMFLGDKNLKYMDTDPVGKKLFKDEEEVGNEEDKVKVVTIAQSCPIYPIKPYAGLHPHVSLDNISPLFNFGLDKTLEDA